MQELGQRRVNIWIILSYWKYFRFDPLLLWLWLWLEFGFQKMKSEERMFSDEKEEIQWRFRRCH
jgi:hypothetical protein